MFQEGVSLGLLEKKREERKKEERKNKERDKKEKKIIKRKKRERKKRERKKERVSEREPWLDTLKQPMHTNNQEAAPLPFQAFVAPLRSALAHMHKGRCTLRPNHKALYQRIMPPMNMVPTHEARVPHTTAVATPRYPSHMLAVSIL